VNATMPPPSQLDVLDLSYNLFGTVDANFWNHTRAILRQLYFQGNPMNATLLSSKHSAGVITHLPVTGTLQRVAAVTYSGNCMCVAQGALTFL
jgi:hypothetical protein